LIELIGIGQIPAFVHLFSHSIASIIPAPNLLRLSLMYCFIKNPSSLLEWRRRSQDGRDHGVGVGVDVILGVEGASRVAIAMLDKVGKFSWSTRLVDAEKSRFAIYYSFYP